MAKIAFPKTKTLLVCALAAVVAAFAIITGVCVAVYAAEDDEYDADACYAEGYDVCVDVEAEGAVLLKNDDCLPLAEGTKVTVLGSMSYKYVEGGTGSAGGKDDENTVMMNDALEEAGLDVNETAWSWLTGECDNSNESWTSYTSIHEFALNTYTGASTTILQSGYTDYAIVTFSRSGAEGASPSMGTTNPDDFDDGDRATYLELNQNEKDLLAWCKSNFTHTIVLINSAAAMELGFLEDSTYGVDACLWIGHPGEAGVVGVGTLLTGRNNPSGALVDTYAYDMSTNPTFYNTDGNSYTNGQTYYEYEEGIYVGYRYYETADAEGYFDSDDFTGITTFKNSSTGYSGYDEVVQFPFGYGMSYTTFDQEIRSDSIKLSTGGTNSVTVRVTNTGEVAGKEVVQLYMEAPYAQDESLGIKGVGLEKSKVVLVGYAKTEEIKPGEYEDVTIEFDTDDLASYDSYGKGCYVLEQGDYYFNIQDNAHCWNQDKTASNAVYDSVSVNLKNTKVYNESGEGKRDSDAIVAENALEDVDAGDGNMLDGYLSRSDFASGMKHIMTHYSNSKGVLTLDSGIESAMNVSGTSSYDYTFSTYENGVKTTKTNTIYAKGGNIMPFSTETPDGIALSSFTNPDWNKTYYVLEDEDGNAVTDLDGYIDVLDNAPTDGSAYHKLCVDDMTEVPIDTDKGLEIWNKLVEETSINEAITIQGASGWQVYGVDSVGKAGQVTVDGPGEPGNGTYNGATWFPCAVSIAATWNDDLAYAEGLSYGHQCVLFGIGGAYAPAMNTHRSPFGGRNFEYYSEDGFIAGNIGGNAVAGIESTGTNVFIKHFALNDGDTNRSGNTTWASEQSIREIYLRPYEISCKDYGANGIMGSLNRIGMSWFHYGMYKTILRDEWGWKGFLITDGDGSADGYNNPQAMLCVEGSMLSRGQYINDSATVAAYGDATQSAYGQTCLHNNMMYCLYQYAYGGTGATSGSSSNAVMITVIVVVAVVVVAAVVVGVVVGVRRSKKKKAQAQ